MSITWLDWSAEPFARAAAEGKPVLLALAATWCQSCVLMDRICYGDPEVVRLVSAHVIPVRVDTDRRPDINERYSLGGWPSTVFLTHTGEMLTGATFLGPDEFKSLLLRVVDAFTARAAEIDARSKAAVARRASQSRAVTADIDLGAVRHTAEAWLDQRVTQEFDETHGGFGTEPKFPHVPVLSMVLEAYRQSGDARLARILGTTLDAMADGGLQDRVGGGFFRCSSARDWSSPRTEKLLDDNARLLRLYVEASHALDNVRYRDVALRTCEYVSGTLAGSPEGAFFASQRADDGYYALETADARARLRHPPVDRTLYVDANSLMAVAYLRAGELTNTPSLSERAIVALETVLLAAYQPGAGVTHVAGGDRAIPGLLADHVRAATALLEAYAATALHPYLMLSEELMRFALRTMWDEDKGGGFFDRVRDPQADEPGEVLGPVKPFGLNCEAAHVLAGLAEAAEKPDLMERAVDILVRLAPGYQSQGLGAAVYVSALRAVDVYD